MSASDIVLVPSRRARFALALAALWPPLLLALTPMPWWALVATTLLLLAVYWLGYQLFLQLQHTLLLVLSADGRLQGFCRSGPAEPGVSNNTVANINGVLRRGGLVSHWALRLCWQDEHGGQRYQRWIFADQCSDEQFRALARAITQCNWQSGGTGGRVKPEA